MAIVGPLALPCTGHAACAPDCLSCPTSGLRACAQCGGIPLLGQTGAPAYEAVGRLSSTAPQTVDRLADGATRAVETLAVGYVVGRLLRH
jgi:hypothetical protein